MHLVGCLHCCTGDPRSHKHQVQSPRMWCCTIKIFLIFGKNLLPSCSRFQGWNMNPWITYPVMYYHIQKIKTFTVCFTGFRVSQWCNVHVDPVFGWLHYVHMVNSAADTLGKMLPPSICSTLKPEAAHSSSNTGNTSHLHSEPTVKKTSTSPSHLLYSVYRTV